MRALLSIAGSALAFGLAAPVLAVPVLAATATTTTFAVKITNVSKDDTLKLPDGSALRAPVAPGVYVVDPAVAAFELGAAAPQALQALAEDGNFEPLEKALEAKFGERAGMFAPGLEFTITARPGDRFSFAAMFVQSNDKFYAPANGALDLFDANGKPIAGDMTALVRLFDAGTEIDQRPGAGADQAPRQQAANQGADQNGVVTEAKDGFAYPPVAEVIRVEIHTVN